MPETTLNKGPVQTETGALNKVPVLASLTLALEEVAAALGLTERALMRKHKRLSMNHGFPPPLPGGVWRWSRAAFEAWVRANGAAPAADDVVSDHLPANDRSSRLIREQNTSLRARYGAAR